MNDTFNFKRFGKFLAYDLNNAKGSYGLSLLITGMMPVILFFFYEFFSVVFAGEFILMNNFAKVFCLVCCIFVIVMVSPSKVYGHLTDKRKGADWLLIPASPLEKTLTLFIIVSILIPVIFLAVFCGIDGILAAVFPNTYGNALIGQVYSTVEAVSDASITESLGIATDETALYEFAGTCVAILSFALGAICFRKNKIGKTILCWFALSIVFSMLIVFIFGHGFSFTSDDLDRLFVNLDPEKVEFWFKFFSTALEVLILGGLITAIYVRIKTIKH